MLPFDSAYSKGAEIPFCGALIVVGIHTGGGKVVGWDFEILKFGDVFACGAPTSNIMVKWKVPLDSVA